jgi:dephospho-CoA kinase
MFIGLTGGIGCGKSTAAGFFKSHGFVVIDSDVLAHQALNEPNTLSQLKSRWGSACIRSDGTADRSWIGKKVFADQSEQLFGIDYPPTNRCSSSRSFVGQVKAHSF